MGRRLKVFFDTNIIMDILEGDRPSSTAASQLIDLIRAGRLEGQICSQSIVDASYICTREKYNMTVFKRAIRHMLDIINMNQVDYFALHQALNNPQGDFEDAALFACAQDSACDAVITNDKDFRRRYEGMDPHIRFFSPEELIAQLTE